MLSSNGQIEKAIHSHPTSASICKICAARSSELDVTRKERQEYLFPARQQPKSINFSQAVCRSVFDLCRSRSNDTRAMQTNFAGESKSPNRQLSFSVAIHMTIKRDNVNVHRAAANIIVSKSCPARGSVCNVLLSRGGVWGCGVKVSL